MCDIKKKKEKEKFKFPQYITRLLSRKAHPPQS